MDILQQPNEANTAHSGNLKYSETLEEKIQTYFHFLVSKSFYATPPTETMLVSLFITPP